MHEEEEPEGEVENDSSLSGASRGECTDAESDKEAMSLDNDEHDSCDSRKVDSAEEAAPTPTMKYSMQTANR